MSETNDFQAIKLSPKRQIDSLIYKLQDDKEIETILAPLLTRSHLKLLCFANSRALCEKLSHSLQQLKLHGVKIYTHYSSLSPNYRKKVETDFKAANRALCFATNTLELGIDIGDIDCVMLYDTPRNVESFLQKIGRGNRKTMRANVLCFIPPEGNDWEAMLRFYSLLDLAEKGWIAEMSPIRLFGAIIQQIFMQLVSQSGSFISLQNFQSFFKDFNHLDKDFLQEILSELTRKNFIRQHGFKYRWGATETLFRFYDLSLLFGNFPISQQTIPLTFDTMFLGEIPKLNLVLLKQGDLVLFGGKKWKIKKIEKAEIKLSKTDAKKAPKDIRYFTPGNMYSPSLINHAWKMLCEQSFNKNFLSVNLKEKMEKLQTTFQFKEKEIPYFKTDNGYFYYTFAGKSINEAIISFFSIEQAIAEQFTIFSPQKIDFSLLATSPAAFLKFAPFILKETANDTFFQQLLPSQLLFHEKEQEWLNDKNTTLVLERLSGAQPVEMKTAHLQF